MNSLHSTIRPAVVPDLIQLSRFVPLFTWRNPSDVTNDIINCLNSPTEKLLVVEAEGQIVSMGVWGCNPAFSNGWHLRLAATLPEMRGRGYGDALIGVRLALASVAATRRPGTPGIILVSTRRPASFVRHGFTESARIGDGPVLMTKILGPSSQPLIQPS